MIHCFLAGWGASWGCSAVQDEEEDESCDVDEVRCGREIAWPCKLRNVVG